MFQHRRDDPGIDEASDLIQPRRTRPRRPSSIDETYRPPGARAERQAVFSGEVFRTPTQSRTTAYLAPRGGSVTRCVEDLEAPRDRTRSRLAVPQTVVTRAPRDVAY